MLPILRQLFHVEIIEVFEVSVVLVSVAKANCLASV